MPGRTGEGQKPSKKDIFAGYIRNQGGSVERAELKTHFKDEYKWTATQICHHINNADNVVIEKIDDIKYVKLTDYEISVDHEPVK